MDNFIVSARKYRPATFDDVVGQHSLTNTLKRAIINHKLAGAYLFCGPRGVFIPATTVKPATNVKVASHSTKAEA